MLYIYIFLCFKYYMLIHFMNLRTDPCVRETQFIAEKNIVIFNKNGFDITFPYT